MKNKGVTYLLLLVVAVIWYQVFFRLKSTLEDDGLPTLLVDDYKINANNFIRDTFTLKANYRDPFDGKLSFIADTVKKKTVSTTIKEKPIQRVEKWSQINYYGLMRKIESKNPLAVIKIDNQQFFLRKGDEVYDGYKVLSIYRDSVLIEYKRKSKYFYKN